MTKCRSELHLGFIRSVLLDATSYYPNDQLEFERDYLRLESLSRTYGDRVFLLDLPAVRKVLDRALETCVLSRTGLPLTRGINSRTPVPRLFRALWLRVFDISGCLTQHIDTTALFLLNTLLGGLKKYRQECSDTVLFNTVKEFFDVDEALPPPSTLWDGDGLDCGTHSPRPLARGSGDADFRQGELFPNRERSELRSVLGTVQQVADRVVVELGEYFPSDHAFRHGPGATAEFKRGKGFKYSFPSWGPRLHAVFPAEEFAFANLSVLGDILKPHGLPGIEEASRLIAVPKTQKAPRLIAAEPTAHQWCQQNIKDFLDRRISSTFIGDSIDFRRQELSQEAARHGSVTGLTATLDLSSASDRLSCQLVESVFRRNHSLLRAFIASRTRYIRNSIDKKSPKLHKLRKFSSMGSALTFPVQSLVFYVICLGVGLYLSGGRLGDIKRLGRQVRIYGDDIVVPVEWVPRIVEVFSHLHLKVNEDKSFWNGKFRESCGLDAYDGDDVTAAYILEYPDEASLGSIASVVDVSNNLYKKGLWHAADLLRKSVPLVLRNLIPTVPIGSGYFGFESICGFSTRSKTRWNKHLQYGEFQSLVPKGDSTSGTRHEGHANLLQYFTEDPSLDQLSSWESGLVSVVEPSLRKKWLQLPLWCPTRTQKKVYEAHSLA